MLSRKILKDRNPNVPFQINLRVALIHGTGKILETLNYEIGKFLDETHGN